MTLCFHTQAGRLRSQVHASDVVPAGRLDSLSFPRRREFRGNDEREGAGMNRARHAVPLRLQGKPPPYGHPLSKGGFWAAVPIGSDKGRAEKATEQSVLL